jgi:hypothetical protein
MNAIRVLLGLGLCLGLCTALARGGFEANAYKVMRLERIPNSPLAKADCQICHVKPNGDAPWNSFGLAVGFWRGKKQTVLDATYSAIRYGGDTDRDGFPDVFERMAGSNPSDRADKPQDKLEDLKKRFDANYKLEADTDTDGFADALEVVAGTLPGDPNSRPNSSLAVLEQELARLGGVEFFAPKK